MKRKSALFSIVILIGLFLLCPHTGSAAQDVGYNVTTDLWAKAVLQPPSMAPVTLVWKAVGSDTTPSGDKVISGYFYADPADFAYGSQYNPEVFVKIYIATNGWCNMAFNHVTVDNVAISSAHHYAGAAQQTGTAALTNRLVQHEYTGVGISTGSGYNGTWKGNAISTTAKDSYGDNCANATLSFVVLNNQLQGTAKDTYGETYTVTGNVSANGVVSAGIAQGDETVATFSGLVSGSTGSGTWSEYYGCRGTWSITKQ
jgi:hypothetical protein